MDGQDKRRFVIPTREGLDQFCDIADKVTSALSNTGTMKRRPPCVSCSEISAAKFDCSADRVAIHA